MLQFSVQETQTAMRFVFHNNTKEDTMSDTMALRSFDYQKYKATIYHIL